MSELFDQFDGFVFAKEREADHARELLRAAVADLQEHERSAASYAECALRLKEIARKASEAAAGLQSLAGAYAIAANVSASGMLEEVKR